jgi:hypothetical protein
MQYFTITRRAFALRLLLAITTVYVQAKHFVVGDAAPHILSDSDGVNFSSTVTGIYLSESFGPDSKIQYNWTGFLDQTS